MSAKAQMVGYGGWRGATPDPETEPKLAEAFQWFLRNRFLIEVSGFNKPFELLRRQYGGEPVRDPMYEGGSNITIPFLRNIIDTIAVRLFRAHFGAEPFVLLRPVQVDEEKASAIAQLETLLNAYFHRALEGDMVWIKTITDAVLFGLGALYVDWRKSENRLEFRYVPLEELFVYPYDPNGELDMAIAMGHTELRSLRWLMEQYGFSQEETDALWFAQAVSSADTEPIQTGVRGAISVRTLFFKYGNSIYRCVYLPHKNLVLEFGRHKEKMFPYAVYRIRPDGRGVGETLSGLEFSINELHNLNLDNKLLTNQPIFKVRKGSSATRIQYLEAGMRIPVETPADIDVLVMPQLFTGIDAEEKFLFELMRLFSGVSETTMGQPPPYSTAYAVESALLEGSVLFQTYLQHGKDAIRRVVKIAMLLMRRGDPLFEYRLLNTPSSPLERFSDEEILNETDFFIVPSSLAVQRESDKQRWLMIRELFKDRLTPEGLWEVDAQILRLMGVQNVEAIIGQKPQPQPLAFGATVPAVSPMEIMSAGGTGGEEQL